MLKKYNVFYTAGIERLPSFRGLTKCSLTNMIAMYMCVYIYTCILSILDANYLDKLINFVPGILQDRFPI